MWKRLTLEDWRVIAHYLGELIIFASVIFIIPFVFAVAFQEWGPAARYLFTIGLSFTVGGILKFANLDAGYLNRRQAIIITALSWVVVAMIGAVPLSISDHYATYFDALFDVVSGLTTTGATVVIDIDHMSYADNTLRFMEHLVGGVGLVVVAMSLGLLGRGSGSGMFTSEGRDEQMLPSIVGTSRLIIKITLIYLVIGGLIVGTLCLIQGIEPVRAYLDGVWLTISAFMTGGFAPNSQSIMYYHSFPIEVILMILMILGAISFVLHAQIFKGNMSFFLKDIEIRTMVIWLLIGIAVVTCSLVVASHYSNIQTLLRVGPFLLVSAFSTTGFQNIAPNEITQILPTGAFLVLAFVMGVGGSAGSTAGGIKLKRVGLAYKTIVSTVKEQIAPDSAKVSTSYFHLGRRIVDKEMAQSSLVVTILFVFTYIVGCIVGIAYGYDATHALFESITMASNAGLTCIVKPDLDPPLILTYTIQMWAGRLEFITLIAMIAQVVVSIIPFRYIKKAKRSFIEWKNG